MTEKILLKRKGLVKFGAGILHMISRLIFKMTFRLRIALGV